jgi:hypothetical protein
VGAGDLGALFAGEAQLLVGTLGAQPEGQRRDLAGARVNVDQVQVVLQDQRGNGAQEGGLGGVGSGQRAEGSLVGAVRPA